MKCYNCGEKGATKLHKGLCDTCHTKAIKLLLFKLAEAGYLEFTSDQSGDPFGMVKMTDKAKEIAKKYKQEHPKL
jgi:hypothetical protein